MGPTHPEAIAKKAELYRVSGFEVRSIEFLNFFEIRGKYKKKIWLACYLWPMNTIPSKANYFLGKTSWWIMCRCETRNGSWQTHVSHMCLSRKSTNTEHNVSLYVCKDERTFQTILLQFIPSNATKLFSATSFLNVFLHFESSASLTEQSSVCHFQWS